MHGTAKSNGMLSAIYHRISMKFEKQTHGITAKQKISKPEVTIKIQDDRSRHLDFHIIGCHFIPNCPISTIFFTQNPQEVLFYYYYEFFYVAKITIINTKSTLGLQLLKIKSYTKN